MVNQQPTRQQLSYEIRIIHPDDNNDPNSFWGLRFSFQPSHSTDRVPIQKYETLHTLEKTPSKGIKNDDSKEPAFSIVFVDKIFQDESIAASESLKRICPENHLIAINGIELKLLEVDEIYLLLSKVKAKASIARPVRFLFQRHDYPEAATTILPVAIESMKKKEQQIITRTESEKKTPTNFAEKVLNTIDLDFQTEAYLRPLLEKEFHVVAERVAHENWQAYQYNGSFWYFNPHVEDIFAEHPARWYSRVFVALASLQCRIAAAKISLCFQQHRLIRQALSQLIDTILGLELKVFELKLINDKKYHYLHRVEAECVIWDEENMDCTMDLIESIDEPDSKQILKPSSVENGHHDDDHECVEGSIHSFNSSKSANYWKQQRQQKQQKQQEQQQQQQQHQQKQQQQQHQQELQQQQQKSPIEKAQHTKNQSGVKWTEKSKSSRKIKHNIISCNRQVLDRFISCAATTIQRHYRGYSNRKKYPRSIPWSLVRSAFWSDVAEMQQQKCFVERKWADEQIKRSSVASDIKGTDLALKQSEEINKYQGLYIESQLELQQKNKEIEQLNDVILQSRTKYNDMMSKVVKLQEEQQQFLKLRKGKLPKLQEIQHPPQYHHRKQKKAQYYPVNKNWLDLMNEQ